MERSENLRSKLDTSSDHPTTTPIEQDYTPRQPKSQKPNRVSRPGLINNQNTVGAGAIGPSGQNPRTQANNLSGENPAIKKRNQSLAELLN